MAAYEARLFCEMLLKGAVNIFEVRQLIYFVLLFCLLQLVSVCETLSLSLSLSLSLFIHSCFLPKRSSMLVKSGRYSHVVFQPLC